MNSTPRRTAAIRTLASNITVCAVTIDEIKGNPIETNCALAFCEIAMKVPPSWFTQSERILIATVAQELYGNATKFLDDIHDGYVSFYNKASQDVGGNLSADHVVDTLHKLHAQEFAGTN
jgi:hypothetical protein